MIARNRHATMSKKRVVDAFRTYRRKRISARFSEAMATATRRRLLLASALRALTLSVLTHRQLERKQRRAERHCEINLLRQAWRGWRKWRELRRCGLLGRACTTLRTRIHPLVCAGSQGKRRKQLMRWAIRRSWYGQCSTGRRGPVLGLLRTRSRSK